MIPAFIREIWDILLVTLALGFIFSSFLKRPRTELDYGYRIPGFNLQDFKLAVLVVAPAIILHELAHKFTAILLGFFWLRLGNILKNNKFPIYHICSGLCCDSSSYSCIADNIYSICRSSNKFNIIFNSNYNA